MIDAYETTTCRALLITILVKPNLSWSQASHQLNPALQQTCSELPQSGTQHIIDGPPTSICTRLVVVRFNARTCSEMWTRVVVEWDLIGNWRGLVLLLKVRQNRLETTRNVWITTKVCQEVALEVFPADRQ